MDLKAFKALDSNCASAKEDIQACLDMKETHIKILDYIKNFDELDPGHNAVMQNTGMDNVKLASTAGAWFKDEHLKPWLVAERADEPRRSVFWLHGTGTVHLFSRARSATDSIAVGTGKTTLTSVPHGDILCLF